MRAVQFESTCGQWAQAVIETGIGSHQLHRSEEKVRDRMVDHEGIEQLDHQK